jgi:3-methyladenine DNA glycosylase AlkD
MNLKQTMATLKKLGKPQNVKIFKRHGAGDDLYGVSFADFDKLKKQIKIDHDLAQQLWATGNTDARTLATMIADPEQVTVSTADAWLREVSFSLLIGLHATLVARSPVALSRLKKWTKAKKESTRQCGYDLLCAMLRNDSESLDDARCLDVLKTIEREMEGSANLARHAMNGAVCAIGIFKPHLQKQAIASARRIGKVEVDHGETSCKTPDAEAYILKAAARQSKKKPTSRPKAKRRLKK